MTQPHAQARSSSAVVAWLFVLYVLFVVYGSLVPFRYVDRSWGDALLAFKAIPFLSLGVSSRADWVANGVLYVPVGFLTAAALLQWYPKQPRALLFVAAASFSIALAVAVEFTQLFFPQRTVSLNDLLAETIGSLIGLALATRFTGWMLSLIASFFEDSQQLKKLALQGYAVAYIAFALFPYDVLLAWPEVQAKLSSPSWGWWIAGNSPRPTLLGLQLLAETVLTLPFGFLLARLRAYRPAGYAKAVFWGAALGVLIEVAQFFIASGISQGLSVLTRALGLGCGLAMARHSTRWTPDNISATVRRYTLPLAAAYVLTLLEINGWLTTQWHGLGAAAQKFDQLSFIPFYYHYFTTEAKALFSLVIVSLSYVPIGLLAWAHQRSPRFAVGVALFVAAGLELGKLFLPHAHADLSNLIWACLASGFTVKLLRQFMAPAAMDGGAAPHPRFILPLLSLLVTGIWLANFPVFQGAVGLLLGVCAVAVWVRPVWVFAIIPAALPVVDLAPWSGRFFLDEFDALLLVTLAVAYARVPAAPRGGARSDAWFASAAAVLALSLVISTVLALWPLQAPDANAFNNYYSPYNALRIVKGAVWAYLLYTLARRLAASAMDVRRTFAWGMSMGLGFTVAVILWERAAFSGLFNFAAGYRVTGPFSAIHVGGAYIECFLAVAVPFLLLLLLEKRHWAARLVGVLLLLAATYALMVTFSRNGYLAFGVAIVLSLLAALRQAKRLLGRGIVLAALAGAMLLVAVPIFKGEFSQARMATVRADLATRQAHWDDALAMRDPGWATTLFGMGLGRYPETNFWRNAQDRSGTYRLAQADGNTYLQLSPGNSLYVEQWVDVQPHQAYVLKLDARATVPNAVITVPVCEKWLLTSYNCVWKTLSLGKDHGVWHSLEARFTTHEFSVSPWYSQRPIKLSLYYAVPSSTIDIDNVRLESAQGTDLLRNGDFSSGLDHWFFSTDGHLQWHTKSLFYGVLFDQGVFGLIALVGFIALTVWRAAKVAYQSDIFAGAVLAATTSFLVVGVFDTLIDAPRFLLLLLTLGWLSAYLLDRPTHAILGPRDTGTT